MTSRKNSAAAKVKDGLCPQCKKGVTDKDLALQCEICDDWYHIKCQNIDESVYDFLGEHKFLHWYCKVCDKNAVSVIQLLSKLRLRQDKLEDELDKLKNEVKKNAEEVKETSLTINKNLEKIEKGDFTEAMIKGIEKEVLKVACKIRTEMGVLSQEVQAIKDSNQAMDTKLETAIEAKLVEELSKPFEPKPGEKKPLFADVVSRQIDTKLDKVSGDINKVQQVIDGAKKLAEEEKDRETRSNNIIIYRAAECSTSDERLKHDKAFCMELFKETLNVDLHDEDLKSVFRIGKTDQSSNCRPLLVQFREKSLKNRVMESLYKLKSADDKFKNISITHDMTQNERVECKALIEEAKKKQIQETGEFLWRVRGLPGHLKLIRFRKQ